MNKENEKAFTVKAYGFQELALMYFPASSPQSASSQLRKWIKVMQLSDRLRQYGYSKGQKLLTPRQVGIIVEHVGEP